MAIFDFLFSFLLFSFPFFFPWVFLFGKGNTTQKKTNKQKKPQKRHSNDNLVIESNSIDFCEHDARHGAQRHLCALLITTSAV